MINFRYHIVSLAAVLFALAAGVVLGAGIFQEKVVAEAKESIDSDISPQLVGFDAGFASLAAEDLIKDSLKGKTVLLVSLPNARESEVTDVAENLDLAGADVTGHIRFTSDLLSPAKKQFVEGVAAQANTGATATGESYDIVGSALAAAYLDPKSREAGDVANRIRSAFVEGKLIENVEEPGRKAQYALIMAGAPRSSDAKHGDVLALLADGLDDGSNGVVIAGPVSSGEKGSIRTVRSSDVAPRISTVDVTDLASGRVTVVLALVSESKGKGGSWGTTRSADGPVPH